MRALVGRVGTLLLALAAGFVGGTLGSTPRTAGAVDPVAPKVVRAQEFLLVDAAGRTQGKFTCGPGTMPPALVLYDDAGEVRGMLAGGTTGGCFLSLHGGGKLRAMLSYTNGSSALTLHNSNGEGRARVSVADNGTPLFVAYGAEDGERVWRAP